jgi:hypothetical protein
MKPSAANDLVLSCLLVSDNLIAESFGVILVKIAESEAIASLKSLIWSENQDLLDSPRSLVLWKVHRFLSM